MAITSSAHRWTSAGVAVAILTFLSGCGDRLSSTYPEMNAFVLDHGFTSQPQTPSPANLGPTAPWYGIAKKSGAEYIVVIYPTTQKMYVMRLGVDGRLTREQMMQSLRHQGYQDAEQRTRLNGQAVNQQFYLFWTYSDEKGTPSVYFDLSGRKLEMRQTNPQTVFSFPGP